MWSLLRLSLRLVPLRKLLRQVLSFLVPRRKLLRKVLAHQPMRQHHQPMRLRLQPMRQHLQRMFPQHHQPMRLRLQPMRLLLLLDLLLESWPIALPLLRGQRFLFQVFLLKTQPCEQLLLFLPGLGMGLLFPLGLLLQEQFLLLQFQPGLDGENELRVFLLLRGQVGEQRLQQLL